MHAYMPYLWIGVVFCAAIAEAIGKRLIALWMIPGGAVASVLAFLRLPTWSQIIAFIGVSTISCFLFFRFAKKKAGKDAKRDGIEDLIGKFGEVIETVDDLAGCGLVSVNGEKWAARSLDYDDVLDAGTTVSVVAVEGVRLICKRA